MRLTKLLSVMFSMVAVTLLITFMSVDVNAGTYYQWYDNSMTDHITVKRGTVVIDGHISDGEYEQYTRGVKINEAENVEIYSEWFLCEIMSEYYQDAEEMARSAKWYFSWDGKYLNVAAQWNAGRLVEQKYPGGDYFSDFSLYGTEEYKFADEFLAYGPVLVITSAEPSLTDSGWIRFYSAIGKKL